MNGDITNISKQNFIETQECDMNMAVIMETKIDY